MEMLRSLLEVVLGTLLQVALLEQGRTRWPRRSLPTSALLWFGAAELCTV